WGEPGVTETIRHLAAFGSERIVTVPVSYPFDGLETLFDVPSATRAARVQDDVRVVHARAWGHTHAFADLLAATIRHAASDDAHRA
ncbi:MAG TPA: ferrochelatase, partial [Coriobacteriia bacterium]|nr:ferrochelatase [Coriobacteriia bacterium]